MMPTEKSKSTPLAIVAESLVASVSEIIECVSCIEIEKENFVEIGCYFYRASPVIIELVETENIPGKALDILQSLSRDIDTAKNLVRKCRKGTNIIELTKIIKQLEEVIKHMGESFSLIPKSTFGDQEYAGVAIRSLAVEMQNTNFEVHDVLQMNEPEPSKFALEEELEKEESAIETDLYPVSIQVNEDNSQILSKPLMIKFLNNASSISQKNFHKRKASSAGSLSMKAQYIEPLYENFFCPLTKEIMDDPVTTENGVTYERKAISEWFEEFGNCNEILCPVTGQKLLGKELTSNVALKTIIDEWKERNEAARIKVHREALSSASSPKTVLEAIKDLQGMCETKWYTKIQVRNAGIAVLLVKLLDHKDGNLICAALKLLRELAEGDDDAKEIIVRTKDISAIIKLLSNSPQPISHAALDLLLELSRSPWLSEEIGTGTGSILVLIQMKYNPSFDAYSAEKAAEILNNLESHPQNIKSMAENGFLEPLVEHLTEGSEEIQVEMAGYLGEIALGNDSKTYVAERASPALLQMVQHGHSLARKAAFQALAEISSYQPNAKVLARAGIVQVMVEEIFTRRIYNEPMNSKNEAAAILANILESGLEFENLYVFHGHVLTSDYILSNIIYMIKNSTPDDLNINLIRILQCMTRSSKSVGTIVSVVKETEASYILIELINNPVDELVVGAIKLLMALTPYMGHTIVERLCKTRGLPENLILSQTGTAQITERQAISAKFLAKLPHQNLTLNLALAGKNTVPVILQTINQIQRFGTRTSRYATLCLEGLVGILVRFTATLYESSILFLAINYNLTLIFTELLRNTSSDEVLRSSAIGLENLSMQSVNLSKSPQTKKSKSKFFNLPKFLSPNSKRKKSLTGCPVHRGLCSSQNTFCLVEARAVEKLLACLDHKNVEVIEAALSAICTMLDDKVDLDRSVNMLIDVNAIQDVLNLVKEHKEEVLLKKSFWIIERFLTKGGERSTSDISQDKLLSATLVSAFHHGDGNTRQIAEKILRHFNKVPNLLTSDYTL